MQESKGKIVLLIREWLPSYSGRPTYVFQLARGLSRRGYEVEVITKSKHEGPLPSKVKVRSIPKMYGLRVWHYLLFRGGDVSLVHAHSTVCALPMKMASWLTGKPNVMTVHNPAIFDRGLPFRKIFDRVMVLETRYSQEISITENLLKARNVNKGIAGIPPAIDVDVFDSAEDGKSKDTFRVLFVGNLQHEKGLDLFFKSMKQVVESTGFIQKKRDFMFHIVGEGPLLERLKLQARQMGIETHVKFHGRLTGSALVHLYKSVDLFVMPSRVDGLPYPLLEACAAGLPILATQVGDFRRVVLENQNGHLVPPGDVKEMAYYLEHFALNPHLEQMGQASRALVSQEYAWDDVIEKHMKIYERCTRPKLKVRKWKPFEMLKSGFSMLRRYRYTGRKTLRVAFTVDLMAGYSNEELLGFLERVKSFCEHLEIKATIFVPMEYFEPFSEELSDLRQAGHEIAVRTTKAEWAREDERKNVLLSLEHAAEQENFGKVAFFRAPSALSQVEYRSVRALNLDWTPVSEDPRPKLKFKGGLPHLERHTYDLKYFVESDDTALLSGVNRLRAWHQMKKKDPFMVFSCHNGEFSSREGLDHASGENFSLLARKWAHLKEHMPIEFVTMSELRG